MHSVDSDDGFDVNEAKKMSIFANRKKRKAGGFQSMGLSPPIQHGLFKKGYQIPTPIQRKIGRFTNLRVTVILGGEKIEDQFSALHSSPDIIVATPGRLLHVIMEMNFSLKSINYVVFDEGDRLFELGFAGQLSETLNRLPANRQTLIFSATLPENLIEFARAGLRNPELVRLDVDCKLSTNLKLLDKLDFTATSIHSGLDPVARNKAIKDFSRKSVRFLLVTDVAARGVDLPFLDNVINYQFPVQPKLFVHRVGRVARAGRSGNAYSIIDSSDYPYLLDLHVFLGRPIKMTPVNHSGEWESGLVGGAPVDLVGPLSSSLRTLIDADDNLASMQKVCLNGMKRFDKTRPNASSESVRRAKLLRSTQHEMAVHPIFGHTATNEDNADVMSVIRNVKLPTIFEALGRQHNPTRYATMQIKRRRHDRLIARRAAEQEGIDASSKQVGEFNVKRAVDLKARSSTICSFDLHPTADDDNVEDLQGVDFFIPYSRGNEATERGLSINNSGLNQFSVDAGSASLNMLSDSTCPLESLRPNGNKMRKMVWDRKRKRFTSEAAASGTANLKKIKTESGVSIPATYKTDRYSQWLKQSKADQLSRCDGGEDQESTRPSDRSFSARFGAVVDFTDDCSSTHEGLKVTGKSSWMQRANANRQKKSRLEEEKQSIVGGSSSRIQLRRPEQVLKQRKLKEKQRQRATAASRGGRGRGRRGGRGGSSKRRR